MKTFWIQVILLIIAVLGSMWYLFNESQLVGLSNSSSTPKQVKINNTVINIEVANSKDERAKGLSGRDSLSVDSGMLFLFEKYGKYRFWMKDVKFPLDLIFIKDETIVDILENVPTVSENEASIPIYEPVGEVDKVLEVNAGFARPKNIKPGDVIELIY
ncbi:MAG: hypothetical protein US86_C0003G0006 [Candidatus Daviesbacteria bacterium GW2011_GWA2_38_24]|uniref:DUF192 domain-containing protein n=1 Tax=Candidatus Daviesbacteria bacterium GW2011_GWA2_38_24 TaxID=1618422 RepID=A0A0G0JGG6_9BACT|nr:MAG: hypothetical protein US86_C0003G0006 [Candidatus Daviesbacteria bacterium GW2011_GWA2_38_24]KKQ80426.1 MAG: hypothetical protein UT01_C0012G0006 [Candidatus Daviesbacteria bacterium GW2011_GWA1_38_7]OGE23877.1 MAG: hypothetical protein A2688_04180 [Candidatus Daviesbacteria bacterium RIFCSPHIGHO2_01_FULL_38_8]